MAEINTQLLPTINASLNGTAAILLMSGWIFIKRRRIKYHRICMTAALIFSVVFLCTYLLYHFLVPGITHYRGQGIKRILYFTILTTHTPLAVAVVPLSITAIRFALRENFAMHVRITKWLLPVWLYVSVTGVIIYLMLYVLD